MFTSFAELIALQLDSEERQAASETALQDERAVSELREQFIAVLGHDLRNPVASVSAIGDLLLRRVSEPDLVKLGQRLRTTSRRMSGLIDDVLDFARGRLGSGIGVAREEVSDLAKSLRDVVSELREARPGRTIDDSGLAFTQAVRCDRARLQQLLSNLVANAVTYGAADCPVVVTSTVTDKVLELSVFNEGECISPETISQVFQPFWRPQTSKPGGGLGLGLYICDQIAKAHGGEMTVSSSPEGRTSFVAVLPIVL